jgi:hypothetical protein|tara:strand:+ start:23 stop:637 length:615 start_codon:yes stop_codon:yes gene_type:complete
MVQVREIGEDQIAKEGEAPPIIAGTKPLKSPYTEKQNLAATFAMRIEKSIKQIEDLENAGYSPVNLRDFFVNNYIPFAPKALENFLSSAEYKQYMRARTDIATAQLRFESGAVIGEGEVNWIDLTYFPEFGDDPQTLLDKRQARREALSNMIGIAGGAYDELKEKAKKNEFGFEQESALDELKERAKNNPDLKRKLIENGLIDE